MNAENWEQIKDLLERAMRIEPARRARFLQDSGARREVLSEVESLLKVDDSSSDFMSLDVREFSKDLVVRENYDDALIGQRVGIYEIKGELGFGGMGAVYVAERMDGKFDQKVALKMLKRELNIGKIRREFQREREILSKLNHPNIARLLDAGMTDDGIPYLVMEYVEGLRIDEFCRRRKLSLPARLKLFNKVCEAVSFAHSNLVIHRDLKPSNILVTANGSPKLLDFGISKLLDSDDKTNLTELGAMTPDYASPEQIKGEAVSTSTDVYSLGVVFYKMLTGDLPINTAGKTNAEVLKAVTEAEPVAPSLSSFSETKKGGEMDDASPPFSLSRIKGDLDNIILKALSKEPERRYATVEQFSADVWRHLDGLPVLARPATKWYRAAKFFNRNRIPVVAAALVFLSLAAGVALAMWQAREARVQTALALEAQRKSEIETEKAKEEQRKSEKVTKFVSKIFGYANPGWFAEGAKTQGKARVIDVVEELSGKIDTEFANEDDVAAALHATFAGIFHWVSKSAPPDQVELFQQKRRRHALRGLELRKRFYGDYHELVATDMFSTFGMNGKTEEERAGILMAAILMMKDTNPLSRNLPFMYEAYTARLMLPEEENLHEAYRRAVIPRTDENKYEIAERMLREALVLWEATYPPDHGVVLDKNCWLAYTLAKQEKWAEIDGPYKICQQIESKSKTDASLTFLMPSLERVRKLIRNRDQLPARQPAGN